MAHERSDRERRLVALTAALLSALLFITGCTDATPAGWLAPGGSRPIAELEVRPGATLAIRVELPPGYVAAELAQRATLTAGDAVSVNEAIVTDEEAFVLELSPRSSVTPPADGVLDLVLGFCEPAAKELCFFDMPSLPVRFVSGSDADEATVGLTTLTYRPEAPQ